VGQLSYIVLGIAILTPASTAGALYHIVAHAFMKITLFMCAGAIFVTAHKKEISEMRGLGRKMPVTFACFGIASMGIAGLPLIAGFVSKMNIVRGAWVSGQPLFVATLVCAALLALTYLIPVVVTGFMKPVEDTTAPIHMEEHHGSGAFGIRTEASYPMLVPIIATAILSVIFGTAPNLGLHLYDFAVSLNGRYRHQGKEEQVKTEQLEQEFDEMSLEYKLSNIRQAKSFDEYLNAIGCFYTDKPVDFDMLTKFTQEELDLIAPMEHERWVREHISMSWKHGEEYEDKDLDVSHPEVFGLVQDLPENKVRSALREQMRRHKLTMDGNPTSEDVKKHYDELPEIEQGKDWKPMKSMLKLIKKYDGLRIYRINSET